MLHSKDRKVFGRQPAWHCMYAFDKHADAVLAALFASTAQGGKVTS